MALFGKKKKTSKERKPASWEAKHVRTERKLAWNLFREQIMDDPDLALVFIAQKLDIEIPQTNNRAKLRQSIRAQLLKEATDLITNDPELLRRHGEKLIAQKIVDIKRDNI
ncbi:MAG: hypothetical protein HN929_03325 [Chloroflexi bacterium]|jgi:hypothetical protein|nr:hypothetical protein [Chloroflexota bacterium]MBT7080492.1 hypothetical protein [Chloroflexota bacterium]MBT7288931.1 hypothetical protein [Chloroflexota bacterium]